ncbi:MAG: hypothetical protein RLY38_575 [Actinomycetota bacterium]
MEIKSLLSTGEIEIEGLIPDSTNGALKLLITNGDEQIAAIAKPDVSIRPLWDFPNMDLNKREYATFLFDRKLELGFVPETVIRDISGIGNALVQHWIRETENDLIIVQSPDNIPKSYLRVLQGYDELNKLITLAHKDDQDLRKLCLIDLIINNADRKGNHLITDGNNKMWAIDHGVSWHEEPKIRTVLWGWINQEFNDSDFDLLSLAKSTLEDWLANDFQYLEMSEIECALERLDELVKNKRFPAPGSEWPAVPWPIF